MKAGLLESICKQQLVALSAVPFTPSEEMDKIKNDCLDSAVDFIFIISVKMNE